jgi:hypothetical protein
MIVSDIAAEPVSLKAIALVTKNILFVLLYPHLEPMAKCLDVILG